MKKLTKGQKYNIKEICKSFAGWNKKDIEGYLLDYYFNREGEYLGADEHGVEPIFFAN